MTPQPKDQRAVPAIRVHQWLPEWDTVTFDERHFRARPPEDFYVLSLPAADLRALSGIYRRTTKKGTARSRDLGIQRRHDEERSAEIKEFVQNGFPWSGLSNQRRSSGDYDDLKKPGWLPTAIVVNILNPADSREGGSVHSSDAITIKSTKGAMAELLLPAGFSERTWKPTGAPPIEVIDGQHRLWAFEDRSDAVGFELPVVAFYGLDISWQAYLFYTINIKPKKINTSLAFDLYPLLRTEDWLERFESTAIYRETRSQEITEALWSYPKSPWYRRIDMLGEGGRKYVTQAAWVRSLVATFVKSFEGRGVKIGGLFGAPIGEHRMALDWSRPQQSAFIILIWQEIEAALKASQSEWATALRAIPPPEEDTGDQALIGRFSLFNSDQGVRGVLGVTNDLCWVATDDLKLFDFGSEYAGDGISEQNITKALEAFRKAPVGKFVKALANDISTFDWRASAAPGMSDAIRTAKARFRGGTGYRELKQELLQHLANSSNTKISTAATTAFDQLGF